MLFTNTILTEQCVYDLFEYLHHNHIFADIFGYTFKMSLICPTVLASNLDDYNHKLNKIDFANRIQIDVMDGIFTDSKSIDLAEIPTIVNKKADLHVMYLEPQLFFDEFIRIKPNMVIVHAESDCDIPKLASDLRENNIKTGLAILQKTPISEVSYLFPHIQHLLIFSGNLGHYGGSADLNLLNKIATAKEYTKFLEYGWDGGANLENISELQKGGVDVINVGSAFQKVDLPENLYDEMSNLIG
jgi:ribulose-phosphate 3-epimerase